MQLSRPLPNVPSETSNKNLSELLTQYNLCTLKLEKCAAHIPGDNTDADSAIVETEDAYATKQQAILIEASSAPLKHDNDIKNLLKLWLCELPQDACEMTLPDTLILSLCHHYGAHHAMRS